MIAHVGCFEGRAVFDVLCGGLAKDKGKLFRRQAEARPDAANVFPGESLAFFDWRYCVD